MPILRGDPQEPVQELPRAVSLSPMTENPPDSLQRLLDEAPFVRLLARDLLASEQDEVVQQTWLQAVRHGGAGIDVPRSWLAHGQTAANAADPIDCYGGRERLRGRTPAIVPCA